MIAFIQGKLAHKEATYVVIDVGGVGYQISISLTTYSQIKDQENCKLLTYFHVKEDAQTLFGFTTESEKRTFLNLISINGVGPSTALMVLSSLSANELRNAILTDDVKTIQSVKGIGAKSAQRIILELKDKLAKDGPAVDMGENTSSAHNTVRAEALTALVTLGINKTTAEKGVDRIIRKEGAGIPLEELIKQALKTS